MKKILLIIILILMIFQMVVLAIAIDIGSAAIDRAESTGYGNTYIDKNNTANETGKITSVEMWFDTTYGNATGVEVATFYVVSENVLSTRDTESIGNVTAGSKQTFAVDLDVTVGDYLGMYFTYSSIEITPTGGGLWYLDADQIPSTGKTYTLIANYTTSLYGTGYGQDNAAIIMGINF